MPKINLPKSNLLHFTYRPNFCHAWLVVQYDRLCGEVSLKGLLELLHSTYVAIVLHLLPVVQVPTNAEPHILLSIKFLLHVYEDQMSKDTMIQWHPW